MLSFELKLTEADKPLHGLNPLQLSWDVLKRYWMVQEPPRGTLADILLELRGNVPAER